MRNSIYVHNPCTFLPRNFCQKDMVLKMYEYYFRENNSAYEVQVRKNMLR